MGFDRSERHTHANQRWIPERISPGVYAFRSAVKNIKTYIHAPGQWHAMSHGNTHLMTVV